MASKDRIYLKVYYAEKDQVKKLGALWDPYSKGWWIPDSRDSESFKQWLPRMHHPDAKPPYLTCLFIPRTAWFDNARDYLISSEWSYLKNQVLDQAGNRCEICGYRHRKYPLDCHEDWEFSYDEKKKHHIQRLRKLMALCQPCHRAIHYSKAKNDKLGDLALSQLMSVNRWTEKEAKAHIKNAYQTWERRSEHDWNLDLTLLEEYDIDTEIIMRRHKERQGFFGRKIDHQIATTEVANTNYQPKCSINWQMPTWGKKLSKVCATLAFIISYIVVGRIVDTPTQAHAKPTSPVCKPYRSHGGVLGNHKGIVCRDKSGRWRIQR